MIQKIKKILAIIKQKSPMYMELKEKVIEAENAKGADLIKLCGRISREIIETSDLKKILENFIKRRLSKNYFPSNT